LRIAWIQHVPFEGLGSIERWAFARGHDLEAVRPYRGTFSHPADFDLLLVMGGPMRACDAEAFPWLAEETAFVRDAADSGSAVLGICLGAQLLSQALGGDVTRNRFREVGWFDVGLTADGVRSPVFGTLPLRFPAFHWHGDTFSVPPGCVLTAGSEACAHQAFECDGGRLVGMQFHLEMTSQGAEALIAECPSDLEGGPHVQPAEDLLMHEARFSEANELMAGLLDAMVAAHVTRRGAGA
jgi:GMP synthase-like glutamine amidotransferase